jgi:hypothetical protein
VPENDSDAADPARAGFWREMLIAVLIGAATLASGWSGYQSALWEGIQTFRLAAVDAIGRDISVKQVALGQQHVLDIFLLERFLDAREDGDGRRTGFFFTRLSPELQAATKTWLDSRPNDNPDAVRSPFHVKGYVQAGTDALEELRKKQSAAYAEADNANRISDNYVRITVFFGLVLFLAGISAVMSVTWPRRGLIIISAVILVGSLVVMFQMPLAAE